MHQNTTNANSHIFVILARRLRQTQEYSSKTSAPTNLRRKNARDLARPLKLLRMTQANHCKLSYETM